ncbi:hypothetical protein KK062_10090 [Fulvivirgaceae bacterium PWU5]|uniref:Uncharacterized protein n=1 Tax=Dawidia cretensis TaxID=2782350 RepID=A0AAP2DYU3_9BACT|nr:hypothetical protein [Dawidia cretensis]MBT1708577.1 hypothetical protein [Dawidia cretensis]
MKKTLCSLPITGRIQAAILILYYRKSKMSLRLNKHQVNTKTKARSVEYAFHDALMCTMEWDADWQMSPDFDYLGSQT